MTDLEKAINGKLITDKKALSKIMFFYEKYVNFTPAGRKTRMQLGQDVFKFADTFFNNKKLMHLKDIYTKVLLLRNNPELRLEYNIPSKLFWWIYPKSIEKFLETLEKLDTFYDLNSNHDGKFLDKRVRVFEEFRGKVIAIITFLSRRSRPLLNAEYKKRMHEKRLKAKKGSVEAVRQAKINLQWIVTPRKQQFKKWDR